MDPIGSFSGIASGFQWRDMVDQMMQIEISRRFSPVQAQVDAATKRREAWNTFDSLLGAFNTAAQQLQSGSAFGVLKSSISPHPTGKVLFTATPTSTAAPGSYQVEVQNLARAEKLSSAAFAGSTEALGISGEFHLNGVRIEIGANDTLARIRDSINAANSGATPSGVTATLLTTSPTEHRLVLTSSATGSRGIELVDGDAAALRALGITTGALSQNRDPNDPNTTQSQRFASHTIPLAAVLGLMPPPAVTTIDIDGRKITVDLENDSLLSLLHRIQAAGGGAALEKEAVGSRELQRLTVTGEVTADADASDPALSQRLVELLGFQVAERGSPITAGEDARFQIDGFEVTRRSNLVTDVIGGLTLNLQAADPGTRLDVVITRDSGEVLNAVNALAKAYNDLISFADAQRAPGAPLAANGSLRATLNSLSRTLLGGVEALPEGNPFTHASLAGVEFTKAGRLQVDTARLKSALDSNFFELQSLLTTSGRTTDPEVEFLRAGSASEAGSYAVEITAAATQATDLGSLWADPQAYSASDGLSDSLVLADSFSGKSVEYTLSEGQSLATTVRELNELFGREHLRLSASIEGDALRITATEYGSSASFTLSGSAAAQLGLQEVTIAGTDVAGTIGGTAATGAGRTLTAAAGSPAEGLSIRYTGSAARTAGELGYVLGVGGMLGRVIEPNIRANDGIIATQVSAIDRSIDSLNRRLDDIEGRLEVRRQALIGQFTRMEGALSLLQSQGNWLAAQVQALQPRRS